MSQPQMPPHDKYAEELVISCAIFDNEAALEAFGRLLKDDFFYPQTAEIYAALLEINANGVPIEAVTVQNQLKRRKTLESVGGMDYILYLARLEYSSTNVRVYADIVRENSFRRKSIAHGQAIIKAAHESQYDALLAVINNSSAMQVKTDEVQALPEILGQEMLKVHEHMKSGKRIKGLETKFRDIDFMLSGLQKTDLIIIAARPSMGKTAFALDIVRRSASQLIENDEISIFFSLEMSKGKLALRMLSAALKINNSRLKFGTLSKVDLSILQERAEAFEKNYKNVYIDDDAGTTMQGIYAKCQNLKSKTGKRIGLVTVDYLQLIESTDRSQNREREVAAISRSLKKLAKEFDCPVVVLSQLSRTVEQRGDKRPILSDLRDSGSIEQDADVVIFLYRDSYYQMAVSEKKQDDLTDIIIAKNRDGATGELKLIFQKEYTRFVNIERRFR